MKMKLKEEENPERVIWASLCNCFFLPRRFFGQSETAFHVIDPHLQIARHFFVATPKTQKKKMSDVFHQQPKFQSWLGPLPPFIYTVSCPRPIELCSAIAIYLHIAAMDGPEPEMTPFMTVSAHTSKFARVRVNATIERSCRAFHCGMREYLHQKEELTKPPGLAISSLP